MSLQLQEAFVVPEDTKRVARAIFPTGNLVMRIRDELGTFVSDADFADLFPVRGQPAEAPSRLAFVTLLQFMEGLTDRQAADAVRTRIDWKYLLCLPLDDPGFHHTVLSEFRTRLLDHGAERRLFEAVLNLAQGQHLLTAGGRQRSDSTHILGAMRAMNRLEGVTETLRHTLNTLAAAAPAWLLAHTEPEWVQRYGPRASDYRLPKSQTKRLSLAAKVGEDGAALLGSLYSDKGMAAFCALPAVETLRQVWVQNFVVVNNALTWRENDNIPPAGRYISSPYDTDARYQLKRTTGWSGYKVHLSETCNDERPNLITNVETTNAAVADDAVTAQIHASLAAQELLPDTHIADTGFVNSELFVNSRERYGVDLIGPTRGDNAWQVKAGKGFAARDFTIDWEQCHAICPAGKTSSSWTPAVDKHKNSVVKIRFSTGDCRSCPSHADCTRAQRRLITIRPQAQHEALMAGRQRELTEEFKEAYAQRAGIEGTIAQGVRSCKMRRSRYMGQPKTHLSHLMTAAAMNIVRIVRWLAGEPKAAVKHSAFERLYLATA